MRKEHFWETELEERPWQRMWNSLKHNNLAWFHWPTHLHLEPFKSSNKHNWMESYIKVSLFDDKMIWYSLSPRFLIPVPHYPFWGASKGVHVIYLVASHLYGRAIRHITFKAFQRGCHWERKIGFSHCTLTVVLRFLSKPGSQAALSFYGSFEQIQLHPL